MASPILTPVFILTSRNYVVASENYPIRTAQGVWQIDATAIELAF
jgi:hypothetical protein